MAKYILILCGMLISTAAYAKCDYGYTQSGPNCVPIICSEGYVLSPENTCVPDTGDTGTETAPDPVDGCPKGFDLVGGRCVGYSLEGGSNVQAVISGKVKSCPMGYYLSGSTCKKAVGCEGGISSDNGCTCPADKTYLDGHCVDKQVDPTCPDGEILANGICISTNAVQKCAMKGRLIGNPQFPTYSGGDLIMDFNFQLYDYSTVPTTVTSVDKYVTAHNVSNALIEYTMGMYKSKLTDPTEYSGSPACQPYTAANGNTIPGYTYDAYRVSGGTFVKLTGF